MACNTGKMSTKKKIAIFSSLGLAIATATYIVFTTTNNPAIAAALPTLIGFAACPLMCIAMGAAMWLSHRSSKNKNKNDDSRNNMQKPSSVEEKLCCSELSMQEKDEKYSQQEELTRIEMPEKNKNPL
jgi:hypothetical protein